MGELTRATPKPLLFVDGAALILYTLFQFHRWGIAECWINTHYLAEQIEEALAHFPYFPLRFSREVEILGTAGGLRKPLSEYANEPALVVMNPDAIFIPGPDDEPMRVYEHFRADPQSDAFLFLAGRPKESSERGWNRTAGDVLTFSESGIFYYIGYSLIRPGSLRGLPTATFAELGPLWVEASIEPGRLLGREFTGKHIDVGSEEAYQKVYAASVFSGQLREEWENFTKPLRDLPGSRLLFSRT